MPSDDIVTRLRAEANRLRFVANGTSLVVVSPSVQDEAADEIERLREENEYLKSLVMQSIPAETQREMLAMRETIYKLSAELALFKNIQKAVRDD